MENVAGNKIAIATAGPTPGIAPMTTPPTEPTSNASITSHRIKISKAATKTSIYTLRNLE
jgi:hypothetical protein